MQGLTETIENIPILPELIENVQDEINKFVFSLLAPYLLPIIKQVQNELQTGSSEIIDSSKNQQHVVFNDDRSTNPTHSMLSKDHFSNVLNEPAGRVASATIKWVVPQLIAACANELFFEGMLFIYVSLRKVKLIIKFINRYKSNLVKVDYMFDYIESVYDDIYEVLQCYYFYELCWQFFKSNVVF